MTKPTMQVRINLFGGLKFYADGKQVLGQLRKSRKTDLFLEYLILQRGRPVPHAELLSALWSDRESGNPATALRTLLHRYRKLIEQEDIYVLYRSIITTRGFYQWNSRLRDCEVDVYEFERLAYEARDYPAGSEERMPFYERMIELYTGPLQLSVVQSWVVPIATYFQNLYADCVYGMIEILKARGEHEKIVALCERAEGAGVSEERLQMEHMLALSISSSAKGRGTMKRKDAQRTYDSARKAEQQAKLAMDALLKQVKSSKDGAYLCEYSTFLELCGVERQLSERMSTVQVLCLMALHAGDISDEELQVQTQRLCELACGCLQGGDAVCCSGPGQVAALFTTEDMTTGRLVAERIRSYYVGDKNAPAGSRLAYQLHLLRD